MKLLLVLAFTLAISLAEDIEMNEEPLYDQLAAASMEPQKLQQYVAPSRYSPPRYPPPPRPTNNYNTAFPSAPSVAPAPAVPSAPSSQGGYFPVQSDPPQNTYYPQNNWDNQNSWNNNQNQNTWNNPQNSWTQKPQYPNNQQNNWNNQNPTNTGSQNNWNKPTSTGSENWNNQNTNNWNNWNQTPSSTSTTTPVAVIKNEHSLGENGSYKYEYQIADGTHVAEEGYVTNPNTEAESIVKKGFYSFTANDGKVYSVTYWADDTGFHAIGDHLPKPPPIPPAIQASIDFNAKEEAAKAEAEKNKQQQQQQGYYPTGQETPRPIAPQQPAQTQYPQQTYYPQQQQQQTYYPPTNYYPPQTGYGRRR